MKKLLILSFAMFVAFAANAQTTQQKNRVAEIRKTYQEALRYSEESQMEPEMDNSTVITIKRMFGGSGMQNKKMEFFYTPADERTDGTGWTLYFVRTSYNYAARKFYDEYLFDKKTGNLIFCFRQCDSYDSEKPAKEEYRSYFYKDGKHCQTIAQLKYNDGKTAVPTSMKNIGPNHEKVKEAISAGKEVKDMFNKVVNAGY